MSAINILFFSNKCEGSKQLLSMLQSEKLTRFFHLICTDNNPKIPKQINVTPTIIIRGVSTPYIAGDAFAWLAKVKQWKMNMIIQKMTSSQQQYLQSINNNLVSDDNNILGFSAAEMTGMSDMFSSFAKQIKDECQDPLPQSYFTCNKLGTENIFTPPTEGDERKIKATEQLKLQKELEATRQKQDSIFKKNINDFREQYH